MQINPMPELNKNTNHFALLLMVLLIVSQTTFAQSPVKTKLSRQDYINKYKNIAIQEMVEFNIPASITMAQGILESGNGNSTLAREANNHFGIKCHKGWEGESMKMNDDAPNECFRKYKTPEESYKDHSFFLSQRGRYSFLFDLEITDYKGWARGLKKAGYATNPKYADLLIKIIEENNLYKLDLMQGDYVAVNEYPNEIPKNENRKYEAFAVAGNNRKVFLNNEKKFIFTRKGDDFYKIADDLNIYNFQLWKYNDMNKSDYLPEGTMLYIEKKRNSSKTEDYHFVEKGETMQSISQHYGIKLKQLYKKNRMKKGSEPHVNQMLWLQSTKPKK
jgi:hypothetical protein